MRRCAEIYRMKGIRLYPNYHQYELEAPQFQKLLAMAADWGLIVQIAVMMEEERTQHTLMRLAHVNPAPLIRLLKEVPKAQVVLQNCFRAVGVAYCSICRQPARYGSISRHWKAWRVLNAYCNSSLWTGWCWGRTLPFTSPSRRCLSLRNRASPKPNSTRFHSKTRRQSSPRRANVFGPVQSRDIHRLRSTG